MPKGKFIRTEEHKKSLSLARKKNWADPNCKYHTEEFKESRKNFGPKNGNFGKPVSEERKLKQSITMKKLTNDPNSIYQSIEHLEKMKQIRNDPNSVYATQEYKDKISKANTGKIHSAEARERHSQAFRGEKHPMWGKHQSKESNEKRRQYNLHRVIPNKDTKIEILLQNELQKRNIIFEKNKTIFGRPDIFIEPNICIFADGDYFHANPSIYSAEHKIIGGLAKDIWKKDWNVTLKLTEQNYFVLRFWENEILKDVKSIGEKIENLLK
jgi:DNA mismatch endonuclease, patch repair protein